MRKKSKMNRYTAYVPKTIKATKNLSKATVKNISSFLLKGIKTVKKTTNVIGKKATKSLRSMTKRRLSK